MTDEYDNTGAGPTGGQPVDPVALLAGRAGHYRGRGADHTGDEFDGSLLVAVSAGGAALTLDTTAVGDSGETQHDEHAVLARGDDGAAQLCAVSSNAPFHRVFALRRTERGDGLARAVFGWGGHPELPLGFREEVTLSAYADGDLGLAWSWGLPGEAFGPRSSVRLHRVD